ncbi:hypothetical protein P7L78_25905 [Tistrella bauzanensis]|uniref:hypothetical protein n=1 Tax=Tistrella TaxID=171436 RepID=UPI0031F71C0C
MSEDKAEPTAMSRRTLLSATLAAPLACVSPSGALHVRNSLVGRCARWLAVEFEADALARRWAALEIAAGSRCDDVLSMRAEMSAIEVKLNALWHDQTRHFSAVTTMAPKTVHDVASLLVVAAAIDARDTGPTGPLLHQAMMFFANTTCPACGAPYIPSHLPQKRIDPDSR